MRKYLRLFVVNTLLLLIMLVNGCAVNNAKINIEGEVWYKELIALPKDAKLIIQINDVSKMDAAADLIAEQIIHNANMPEKFLFVVDKNKFKQGHTYAIGAKIMLYGKLLFINTQAYRIDFNQDKSMSIMLNKIIPQ